MDKSNDFRGENLGILFQKHDVVKVFQCPVCDLAKFSLWADCGYTQAHKCDNCSLVFMSSQLSEPGLADYYSNYIGKRRIKTFKIKNEKNTAFIYDKFTAHSKTLA